MKKLYKKFYSLLCVAMFVATTAFAQSADVPFNGVVVDKQGVGIARVKVSVEGSIKYAITDKQGRFGLTNIAEGAKFIISQKGIDNVTVDVAGYRSLRIVVDAGKVVEVQDSKELEEAGFRFVKRREILPSGVVLGEDLRRTH